MNAVGQNRIARMCGLFMIAKYTVISFSVPSRSVIISALSLHGLSLKTVDPSGELHLYTCACTKPAPNMNSMVVRILVIRIFAPLVLTVFSIDLNW